VNSLLARLQTYSGPAVITHDGRTISYETLKANASSLRETYRNAAMDSDDGLSGSEAITDLAHFVTTLLALESVAEQITFTPDAFSYKLPSNVSHSTIATTWFIQTSGTTGSPKKIAHTTSSICSAIQIKPHLSELRWALTYQPHRFAGLQVVLQGILSGACIIDCLRGDIADKSRQMLNGQVNALSATPSFWRQFLFTEPSHQLAFSRVSLGGEIADQPLLDALVSRYPKAKIFHIYASTEAGVGFAVSDGKAGFPEQWLETGVNGIRLRVKENILWLKPAFTDDTVNRKNSNEAVVHTDEDGYINTQDAVSISHHRVFFKGRDNGVINVGGHKVFPEQVESVLLSAEQVALARVYSKPHKVLGQIVIADVVLQAPELDEPVGEATSTTLSAKQIQMALMLHCKTHLNRADMPTKINIVPTLPLSDSGKVSRQ